MKLNLQEVSRRDLVTKSRHQDKVRFNKRLNYQITNFRGVDLKELFENDLLVFQTPVKYLCTISFPGVFSSLKNVIKTTNGDPSKITLQMVIRAVSKAFDAADDVKVRCSCDDFRYRFMWWANRNGYLYGPLDPGTEKFPEKTNPDDMLGATCKHLNLLLSNKRWITKTASVINAFIKAYPEKAAKYLYDEEDLVEEEPEEEPEEITPDNQESVEDDSQGEDQEEV